MTVQAAPNQCVLVAKVKRIKTIPDTPAKSVLDLEIIDSQDIDSMPNFGKHHIGTTISANTLEDVSSLKTGEKIRCTAEYIGGPFGGAFNLTAIHLYSQ